MIKLPSIEQCFGYFDQFSMLENIRAHSIMVARVALTLHNELTAKPNPASLPAKEEIIVGALMHDIAKTPCLTTGEPHAACGQKICEELGYPELGEIVNEHVLLKNFTESRYSQGHFGAKELVFYADKRVNHDQLATLHERQEYILARYGKGDEKRQKAINANFASAFVLEQYLFDFISFSPEKLIDHLKEYPELFIKKDR